jgi:phosphocarrier protein HPr
MKEKETIIKNETGLHARPASLFVKKASEYKSDIKVFANDKEVNAKSIMSIMSLGATKGTKVIIRAKGEDEEKAVDELIEYIEKEMTE